MELLGATCAIYLLAKPAGSSPADGAPPRDYGRHWTPVHLDVVVPDVEAAVARAEAAGAKLEAPVRSQAWGRLALMADPFGHGFCLTRVPGPGLRRDRDRVGRRAQPGGPVASPARADRSQAGRSFPCLRAGIPPPAR